MRQDIKRRLKKLEDAHGSQQPPKPDNDVAVRVWKFLLAKHREVEERSGPLEIPPPTLEWVRERIARRRGPELETDE
jgi:hypothetical protein